MKRWPYGLTKCTRAEINRHCVHDEVWQQFRRSLKGKPTEVKLDRLANYYAAHRGSGWTEHVVNIQVSNYINALKRGGQLTMDLEVKK